MRTRHPTRNLLDDILFLGILIITPIVVALYHGVETLAAIPEYQAVASPPSLVNAGTPPVRTAYASQPASPGVLEGTTACTTRGGNKQPLNDVDSGSF